MLVGNLRYFGNVLYNSNRQYTYLHSLTVIFYERSFAMASFALILTNILRQLEEWNTDPPVWISAATAFVLRSRVGQILLVSVLDPVATAKIEADADDNTDLVRSDSKRSPWKYVTVLVGWLAVVGVFLAYVALLATCLPMYVVDV